MDGYKNSSSCSRNLRFCESTQKSLIFLTQMFVLSSSIYCDRYKSRKKHTNSLILVINVISSSRLRKNTKTQNIAVLFQPKLACTAQIGYSNDVQKIISLAQYFPC